MNSCLNCGKDCINIFCSRACSAIINNARRKKPRPTCLWCGKTTARMASLHCSHECHAAHQYKTFIEDWKKGKEFGVVGKTSISDHIRRYLKETRGNKCEKCGWCEINSVTGNVPVQIEHVDGNWKNNKEENLLLLCPNCHSLTPTYGGLNKGNGRKERKYIPASMM